MTTTMTQLSRTLRAARGLRPLNSPAPASNDATDSAIPDDPKVLEFVTAPMILRGQGGWETNVPDWLRGALPVARLKYLRDGGNPDLACELDAVLYLMSASLCMPLGSDWTRIYLHIAFKQLRDEGVSFDAALGAAFKVTPSGHTELPDDDWVRDADKPLSRYEQEMLDHLRGQIRAAQIRHVQRARRARPHRGAPAAPEGAP